MRHALTVTMHTTDDEIDAAIPFRDMREEARTYRDSLAAIESGAPDYEVHDDGRLVVMIHPALRCALVNERGTGVGDSLILEAGTVSTVDEAVARWRQVSEPLTPSAAPGGRFATFH